VRDGVSAVAVAVDALDGGKCAVVLALDLGHVAYMCAKTRLLILGQALGNAGVPSVIVAAHVFPKFLVGSAGALPCPGGISKLLDEHFLVAVTGLVGRREAREELAVVFCAFVRE
jgi:hypothetical protein